MIASHRSVAAFALSLAAAHIGCAPRATGADPPASPTPTPLPVLTVKALLDAPGRHRGEAFRVRGGLENAGTNYFKDTRIVLRDDEGRSVPVLPWLPMEFPKGPPGAPAKNEVLSSYLGKTVTLEATLVRGELPLLGVVDYLKVDRATISDDSP